MRTSTILFVAISFFKCSYISSVDVGTSSKIFSIKASSKSAKVSSNFSRISSRVDERCSGILTISEGLFSVYAYALSCITSAAPMILSSSLIGICLITNGRGEYS